MVKKILSLMVTLVMLLSIIQTTSYAEESITPAVGFMISTGLFQGDESGYRLNDCVKRSEFTAMVLRMMGLSQQYNPEGTSMKFTDVPKEHWAYADICYAYEAGIINGKTETSFAPDDFITLTQAAKILLNIADYQLPASTKGGYPNGYTYWALKLDLYDDVSSSEFITRKDACTLIYNMLEVPLFDTLSNEMDDGTNILTSFMQMDVKEGTLIATYQNNKNELKRNQVNISGVVYQLEDYCIDLVDELIGQKVICYIDRDEKIVYIKPDSYVTDIIVNSDDISPETDLTEFIYFNSNSKRQSKKLDINTTYFYNGSEVGFDVITPALIKPSSGTVKLRDVDGDNKIDIVIVSEYVNYVIHSVIEDTIYDKYGNTPIYLEDYKDRITIYDADGNNLELSDLQAGSVASVMRSLDNKSIIINVSYDTAQGRISAITDDNEYEFDSIYGGTLSLKEATNYLNAVNSNHRYAIKPELGRSFIVYLDYCGMIADMETTEDEETTLFGYLVDMALKNGYSTGEVKLLTLDNRFAIFELEKKVEFGRVSGGKYMRTKENAKKILTVVSQDGTPKRQLIKYALNDEGKISEFYLAASSSLNLTDAEFTKHTSQLDMTYRENTLDQMYYLDKETAVFYAPLLGKYEKLLSAGTYNKYFKNGTTLAVDLYNCDDYSPDAVVINLRGVTTYDKVTDGYETIIDYVNSPLLYINKVKSSIAEDGEFYTTVEGYQDGKYVSVYISDELLSHSENRQKIKKGTVIQYETNSLEMERAETSDNMEQIILFKQVFDFTNSSTYGESGILWEYDNVVNTYAEISTMWGTVSNSDERMFAIEETDYICSLHGGTKVMVYSDENGFELKNINEIVDGRKAFVRQRYQNTREVVLY